jgi:hypothetical protein
MNLNPKYLEVYIKAPSILYLKNYFSIESSLMKKEENKR